MKICIDCDPGVDDSLAILFALARPDVEVVGISTSVGNVTAKQGADNALRILKLAGMEHKIPVCVGAEQPLNGDEVDFPEFIHGKNGIGNVELAPSDQKPVDMDVCDFLYQIASENEGELVLVTLGRMTNIAKTIKRYPDFAGKIKKVVSMGGTVLATGNVSPVVEANIGGDPEAADIVVQTPWDMTMVGLDVTLKTILRKEDLEYAEKYCREECKEQIHFLREEMKWYMQGARQQNWMRECCPLHDPLAMIVAVDPSVVKTHRCVTRIECEGAYCKGMVVTDLREYPIDGEYVNHEVFRKLLCTWSDERSEIQSYAITFDRSGIYAYENPAKISADYSIDSGIDPGSTVICIYQQNKSRFCTSCSWRKWLCGTGSRNQYG